VCCYLLCFWSNNHFPQLEQQQSTADAMRGKFGSSLFFSRYQVQPWFMKKLQQFVDFFKHNKELKNKISKKMNRVQVAITSSRLFQKQQRIMCFLYAVFLCFF
jgi:hypothetical protein